ncbi:LPS assembly lipoprotein LptE [Aquimarina sp. D1M17]|uniref:LptE family protein n=1 Tax=Aquimarina acroporae TaxID=2937283 RepID=UPI0020BDA44B|nr:LptE family protein [Aquimarina acroporae]MCK8521220.1 LPS assembly lipoprotein LptE [Aquimarina acroporae]
MNIIRNIFIGFLTLALIQSCGIYSFSGTNISPDTKTFQVNFFQNQSPRIFPGADQTFTNQLQDLILNQTNLDLVTSGGDIVYEGEIVQDYVSPNTATSDITAAQNRLTIAVNMRFYDAKDSTQDLEQRFSFFFDYPASQSENTVRDEALQIIFERITQDMFNATLARW